MKTILALDYTSYVLDVHDALKILEILEKAERYEQRYRSGTESNTHHVWSEVPTSTKTLALLPDELYRMAKLAGKPE